MTARDQMTVEQVGRVRIRKHGDKWLVKRYVRGQVFVIHSASHFNGILAYMDTRKKEW